MGERGGKESAFESLATRSVLFRSLRPVLQTPSVFCTTLEEAPPEPPCLIDANSSLPGVRGTRSDCCIGSVVCGTYFFPCATVTRHRIDMVKSKSTTTITVRNERRIGSHMGTKRTSNKPTKACNPRRMPTICQKTLLPHAGRNENTIVANSNMMYAGTVSQPATSWKCS